MADVPLPAPACIVTTLGSHRPQHFMLSTSRGVALMEKPIGSTLNLFADDQMHAHAAVVTAADNAQLWERLDVLEDALNKIASWREGRIVNSWFDEPFAAEIARAALEKASTTPPPSPSPRS